MGDQTFCKGSDNPRQYAVPSIEFSFSCSPSPGKERTPLSSRYETPGFDVDGLQPTSNHLAGLRLDDGMSHAAADDDTPTVSDRAPSICTDTYNATPSPEKEDAAPVTIRQESISGAFPSPVMEDDETTSNSSFYSVREEELPQMPVYDMRLQSSVNDVKSQLTSLAKTMRDSGLVQNRGSNFHALCKEAESLSRFKYPETRVIGLIGDTGVGKSSVVNSLLNQDGLARSSGDGAACTCVVTEFRHVDEKHPDAYTVEADFMDNSEMEELLKELLINYRQYYTSNQRYIQGREELLKAESLAIKAWETLKSLFPKQTKLDRNYLADESDGAVSTILESMMHWAVAGLAHRPGSGRHSAIASGLDDCKARLDHLTESPPDSPALWPFIKLIRVYLSSPVLQTGLVLADLPGLRDLNYARVRATEMYLRHKCDEILIVSRIARCVTDESIQDIMRRCVKGQPLRIVGTMAEDIRPNETTLKLPPHAGQLHGQLQDLEGHLTTVTRHRRKSSGSEWRSLAAEEARLGDEKSELEFQQKEYLMKARNEKVTKSLIGKHGNVSVFCVSNTMYSEHRNDLGEQGRKYVHLSGIVELRRYCQSVPAEGQWHSTTAFIENQVPAFLGSVNQLVLSASDGLTAEKTTALRQVLGNAEATFERTIWRQSLKTIQGTWEEGFESLILQKAWDSRADWTAKAVGTSEGWKSMYHSSYRAFCRKYGKHKISNGKNRNWNEELLQPVCETLDGPWSTMVARIECETRAREDSIKHIFQTLCESFEEHSHLAPEALENLVGNMERRKASILGAIRSSLSNLLLSVHRLQSDMLHGHDSSYMARLMQPVYHKCGFETGTGCTARCKEHIYDHLQDGHIFIEFHQNAREDYTRLIEDAAGGIHQRAKKDMESIIRDMRAVVADEGEVSEAEQLGPMAGRLKEEIAGVQEIVDRAKQIVKELM